MLGPQRPSLELSAGRKLVVQAGMSLEVVRDQRNTFGRQIGRRRHEAFAICAQSPGHQTRVANFGEAHYGVEALLRSEEHTSELQSHSDLVCRLLLEKKKQRKA